MPVAREKPAVVNEFISFHIATKGGIFHKGLSRYFTFGNRRIFHLIIVPSFLAVRYMKNRLTKPFVQSQAVFFLP